MYKTQKEAVISEYIALTYIDGVTGNEYLGMAVLTLNSWTESGEVLR